MAARASATLVCRTAYPGGLSWGVWWPPEPQPPWSAEQRTQGASAGECSVVSRPPPWRPSHTPPTARATKSLRSGFGCRTQARSNPYANIPWVILQSSPQTISITGCPGTFHQIPNTQSELTVATGNYCKWVNRHMFASAAEDNQIQGLTSEAQVAMISEALPYNYRTYSYTFHGKE